MDPKRRSSNEAVVPEFDLDRYLRAAKRLDLSGVDWDRVGEHPLTAAEARILTYMMDIESHTVVYLRDLLATSAAAEPDVTAFLSCWVYEELWHGEALSRFLGEAGWRIGPDLERVAGDAPFPSRTSRMQRIRRGLGAGHALGHLATLAASSVLGRDFVAVHMTWGATNELSTLTAYQQLIGRTRHPVLADLLRAVVKDERRHFAFYRAQARMRLDGNPRAQRLTRWALRRLWAPVGTGVRPQGETDFVVGQLFGDARGTEAVAGMDATVHELPGLDGLGLFARARADALGRGAPVPAPADSALAA